MKRVPYGESSFKEVIDNDLYYIDKTKYIEILEMMPRFQFFIRPRRFGKSLFLSMLETYYDSHEKEKFKHYFGDKYIGKNPSKEANRYIVLRLSFAGIITDRGMDEIISGFDKTVFFAIEEILYKYKSLIGEVKDTYKNASAVEQVKFIMKLLKRNNQKLMVLIDEYDNFANGLMIKDEDMYKSLVQTDGYIKSFYKEIKEGTAEGVISRVFITGVSPILLDDLTSGANIFENISNEYTLNSMMGVTTEELLEMIDYYQFDNYVDKEELLTTMKDLYDGYRFNKKTVNSIYNTGMVMYFTNKMHINHEYPDDMLDNNIKTDYGKIKKLAQNFESKDELREIIENNTLIGPMEIKSRFGIETLFNESMKEQNFISLMYYLGLLTIKKNSGKDVYLGIPNYSVKTMYWEYLYNTYEVGSYKRMEDIKRAFSNMRKNSDVKDVMNIYSDVRKEISNRDLTFYNEMTSKSIFIALVFIDNVYIIESEKENREGYSDLYLKEGVTYKEEVKYRYVIEFKHIKQSDYSQSALEKAKKEATLQLEKYCRDNQLLKESILTIKKMIIISVGKKETFYEILN